MEKNLFFSCLKKIKSLFFFYYFFFIFISKGQECAYIAVDVITIRIIVILN